MNEKNVETLLEEEIRRSLMELNSFTVGSEERAEAIADLEKLYKLRLEEKNLNAELEEKKSSDAAAILDRKIRLGVDIGAIILPLLFYGRWMRKGFKFEETGTFTSVTFRNLFSKFRPGR